MLTTILAVLTAASAALFLSAHYLNLTLQLYIFKPLTMLFVILNALLARRPVSPRYRTLILLGLILSLAGDVLLILPSDQFVLGLVSFLLAHIVYIAAFRTGVEIPLSLPSTVPFIVFGILALAVLAPGLGQMALPVLAYVIVILVMAWQALGRWRATRRTGDLLAFAGALLFVLSDTVLAFNRFRFQFPALDVVVWISYVAAQWLISQSVQAEPDSRVQPTRGPAGRAAVDSG
ncbi:lysoplasmalogenase [Chloroflexota bacterium]